ncbi:MAG: bifunctional acetaldehyde-CoA/alcohol dehydrogenase [Rickettsiales bacterium]|jgi:acetaldehyde dehydrogenase/alcohol dehydrogenase|nr:bifunctional acetaldehyde-CoA/alcohol dehydrogenase [Rickettsiales bacterium]
MIIVNSLESLDSLVNRVKKAQNLFAEYSQEKVDEIFRQVALFMCSKRIPLAKMAVEETGMGIVEDKVIKNHFSAEYIYNKYKHSKTCGLVGRDAVNGLSKIACPVGVIAGIIPTTNPTSTAIFKGLITLKTRNGIVVSPHPRAKKCTCETLRLMLEAAVAFGAPENIIGWIDEPTIELSGALMSHRDVNLILATGGPAMVRAAYSSGTPSIGVGAGNTPAVIDETADLQMAVSSIILSKTFDNGMICASEQSVIVVDEVYQKVRKEFEKRGCYILKREENAVLANLFFADNRLNADIVGQSACKIADMAGIKVPTGTKILIGEVSDTTAAEPFAHEKLSPILAMYKAKSLVDAIKKAQNLVELGGNGHTSVLYTKESNGDRIEEYSNALTTSRIIVNSPASQGAIGDLFNFRLEPSLTLGCGSWGHNSVSENIGVKHLINIKVVAEREENMLWFKVPPKIYFKKGCVSFALRDLKGKKKAFIITDKVIFDLGYTKKVTDVLEELDIKYTIFSDVEPDPSLGLVQRALGGCRSLQPDVIIALGGGSPIDAAKLIWLMYEQPDVKFEDIAMRFLDIRKRAYMMPDLGKIADLVCIPTTSGTGSEVTPFTIITDEKVHNKYAIADYAFTPSMAIVDPDLATTMPRGLAAASGIDALVHGIEAYVSTMASPFTDGLALQAIKMVFANLSDAVNGNSIDAKEQMHYAANIAGMAFSNAFLGICHSMAHKLGARFNIPHGIANAYCISQVIRYNSSDKPVKQAVFAQYRYPFASEKYSQIADFMGFGGKNPKEKIDNLIAKVEELKAEIGIAPSIKAETRNAFKEKEFIASLDDISERAFDDQCTGSNPRYPLIAELKQLFTYAYSGEYNFEM